MESLLIFCMGLLLGWMFREWVYKLTWKIKRWSRRTIR